MGVTYVPPGTCAIPQSNRVDNLTTTVYVGTAAVGAAEGAPVWAIKKLDFSGTLVLTTWADGNPLADNIWTNRASLSYS